MRQLLLDTTRKLNVTLADLSRHVGRNLAYIHQFVHRGSPRELPDDVRESIEAYLGLKEGDLASPEHMAALKERQTIAAGRAAAPSAGRSFTPAPAPEAAQVPCYADTGTVTGRPRMIPTTSPADLALTISKPRARGRLQPGDIAGWTSFPPARIGDVVLVASDGGEIRAIGTFEDADETGIQVEADGEKKTIPPNGIVAYRLAWIRTG